MYRIELVKHEAVEALAVWPDQEQAEQMRRFYSLECRDDPGFICVRLRKLSENPTPTRQQ